MNETTGEALYSRWLRMWNGELDLAEAIIDRQCTVHQAPFGPGEPLALRGPGGVRQMVELGRAPFDPIAFHLTVGPVVDGGFIAARWRATGAYRGGIPGATAPAGTAIEFHGNDILRLEAGKVAEYWVSSDGAHLMAQLGML